MNLISRTIAIAAGLLLASCGETRLENPEFFEKKSGLPLCSSAKISNKTVGDHDFETDFVYSVDIEMDNKCEDKFLSVIERRLRIKCDSLDYCSFMDSSGWSYVIKRTNSNKINFTLRAI